MFGLFSSRCNRQLLTGGVCHSDETKYATNFTLADLPAAIRTLQLAQSHIEAEEATVAGSKSEQLVPL